MLVKVFFTINKSKFFKCFNSFKKFCFKFFKVIFKFYIIKCNHCLMLISKVAVAFFKICKFNISYTNTVSSCFVHISWTNTFKSRTNFSFPFRSFRCSIQQTVCR